MKLTNRFAAIFLTFALTILALTCNFDRLGLSALAAESSPPVSKRVMPNTLQWPVQGTTRANITSHVDYRSSPGSGATTYHHGMDIGTGGQNLPVLAVAGGTAKYMAYSNSRGNWVVIDHGNGWYTDYQHLSSCVASRGSSWTVNKGDTIGYTGDTGVAYGIHLHFEVTYTSWGSGYIDSYDGGTWGNKTWQSLGCNGWAIDGWEVVDPEVQNYTLDPAPSTNLKFTNVTYPKSFKIDTTNGWSLGSGTLESNYTLTSIRSEILNSSGESVSDSGVKTISGYSYAIKTLDDYSGTNNGVRFSWISNAGNYIWRLTATDSGGRTLVMDMPFSAVSNGSTSTATMSKEYPSTISVTGVTVDLDSVALWEGETTTVTSTVSPSNATNSAVTWTSSNTAIATVTPVSGNARQATIKAVKAGTATITCKTSDGGKTATCSVTVKKHVTGIDLSPTPMTIKVGETSALTATVLPSDATNKTVHWSSDNTSIATVNNGAVKGIATGTATITAMAEDGGYTKTCTVTVVVPVSSITMSKASLSLAKGNTSTLTVGIFPSNASNKTVNWASSNTSVATINNGVVKAVGVGNATITCTAADGYGAKETCTVTVLEEVIPDFKLPSGLKEIGEEAFAGIDAQIVIVPDGVKTIGKQAFADCTKLVQITIPAATTSIAKDAFANVASGFTIHGSLNSYAQTFASENGIRFVADDACTITFNANGGVGSETSRMIKKGSTIGTLPTASKSNNTLDGWYTSASGGTKVTTSAVFSTNTTLYAHWTALTCTITFNGNGGTCGTSSKVVNRGEAIGTLPTPARTYYAFQGWYTQQSGGSPVTTATTFTQDQAIYARWELNGFGNWSEWSTTPVSGNDNREVQSEVRSVQTGTKTIYNYNRFLYWRPEKGYYQASYGSNWATSNGYSGSWQYLSTESKLPVDHTTDGQNVYLGEVRDGNKWWYNESTTTEAIYGNVTYYRYRDRIQ